MERLITDIGQYGTMIEQATAALDEPIDTNTEYRDRQRQRQRQRQMYTDYQAAWDSQGRDSHRAFLRMINDPDQRAEFEADVAAVAEALPALDPALRKVMAGFFDLVGHQIDEVERIQQRCAQRVNRFTAFGTMEHSRGVARQLNEAIGAARALLKSSFTDSRLDIEVPLARHAISSVGALGFRIGDLSNPKSAKSGDTEVDLTSFAALTTQVDAPAMSDLLNHAITTGPVSLPDAVALLDTAYLGHVIVLWSWALKQPNPDAIESTTVRRSLDGRDREIAVPRLTFTEPITTLAGAPIVTTDTDIDFSSPPQVDQTARPPVQRRRRFGGDVSELPDRACWARQHLLTRRYLSAEADADVSSWVLEYRKELSVRLSELDPLLRIVDTTDVAFGEQARYESARGIKLLRPNRSVPTTPSSRCTSHR
jgi:hypothetical protein